MYCVYIYVYYNILFCIIYYLKCSAMTTEGGYYVYTDGEYIYYTNNKHTLYII